MDDKPNIIKDVEKLKKGETKTILLSGDMIIAEETSSSKSGAVNVPSAIQGQAQLVDAVQTRIEFVSQGAPNNPQIPQLPNGLRLMFTSADNLDEYDYTRDAIRFIQDNKDKYAIRATVELVAKD